MIVENSAKAVILRNNKILLIKNYDENFGGDWYSLPGGRQNFGENLTETLKRECLEEINVIPNIDKLLFIREYIHENHEYKKVGENMHKVEFMFLCSIDSPYTIKEGILPDKNQKSIVWVDIDKIKTLNIFPRKLKQIDKYLEKNILSYWGDIL